MKREVMVLGHVKVPDDLNGKEAVNFAESHLDAVTFKNNPALMSEYYSPNDKDLMEDFEDVKISKVKAVIPSGASDELESDLWQVIRAYCSFFGIEFPEETVDDDIVVEIRDYIIRYAENFSGNLIKEG